MQVHVHKHRLLLLRNHMEREKSVCESVFSAIIAIRNDHRSIPTKVLNPCIHISDKYAKSNQPSEDITLRHCLTQAL